MLLIAGLALFGLAGEAWLRWTVPFMEDYRPMFFVPGVGRLLRPNTETRWTNGRDLWIVSRTNRLGFLDREPPSPERAAQGCHIAMIGDSFVEAKEVSIPEKFHVRLEAMAARELPTLAVTTSAFGRGGTGQINQLAFYDAYARPLRPRLVVLVFVLNDFMENFHLWKFLRGGLGLDPDHLPYVSAARAEDGSFRLRPPSLIWQRDKPPQLSAPPATPWRWVFESRLFRMSWMWRYAERALFSPSVHGILDQEERFRRRMEVLIRDPAYAYLIDEWLPGSRGNVRIQLPHVADPGFNALFAQRNDSPFFTEALAFTAFGFDEFKKRTERDGAALVVLASHDMRRHGDGALDWLNGMAAERGIPVIDQGGFIRRQGAELRDAHWPRDYHWNPAGHRWVAEALLEYLKENQDVCG